MMPDRIQRRRVKGWRKPEGAVIVDRTTIFGNPWVVGAPGGFWLPTYNVSGSKVGHLLTNADAVHLFRRGMEGRDFLRWMLPDTLNALGRADVRKLLRAHFARIHANLPALRGHDLCCWCGLGEDCHADHLMEIANA